MKTYRVAIPIIGPNMRTARADLEKIAGLRKPKNVTIIPEIRADKIRGLKLKEIYDATTFPLIFTARHKSHGGNYEESEKSRIKLLQNAIDIGFSYVDVEREFYSGKELRKREGNKLIVSHHDFKGMPDLIENYNWIDEVEPDIIKIAGTALNKEDNRYLYSLISLSNKPIIGICMGEIGKESRIWGPLYGSYLTFAALDAAKNSAPGQITFNNLLEIWKEMNFI